MNTAMVQTQLESLVVIIGETASGKSALAMELAQQFNGEIISADSWTVYSGFDIGTAKPSKSERASIPHHLLDIADPKTGFSAAEFKRLADQTIDDIQARGKLPILVGGTGLYIDSVIYDYGFLPAGTSWQRQELNSYSIDELLAEIKKRNIDLTGIDIRNKRRLVRLIEVDGQRPTKSKLRKKTLILGLHIPKDQLEQKVAERTDKMLQAGLEKEVKDLIKIYGWKVEPIKGIGYREWQGFFEGKKSLQEVRTEIIRNSLQLAKKQRTWFKRNNSIQWLQKPNEAKALVQKFLSKS